MAGVADVLPAATVLAFCAVGIAFAFLYDRSVGSGIYEAAEEADCRDEHVARPV